MITIRLFLLLIVAFGVGCERPQSVLVDYSTPPMKFVINHQGWPRPFRCPRVTEFAIASDQDEEIWHVVSNDGDGAEARDLSIVYGDVPGGFRQVFPEKGEGPPPLRPGRIYYIAAAGSTTVYRMVFSLPLDSLEAQRQVQTGR